MAILARFMNNEDGATAIEYALMASLIALFIIAAVQTVGTKVSTVFTRLSPCTKMTASAAARRRGQAPVVRRGLWRFQIQRGRKMRLSDHRARRRDPDRVEVLAIVGAAHVPELHRSPRQIVKPEAVQRFPFKRYIVAQEPSAALPPRRLESRP